MTVRYFVRRADDGTIVRLARICETDTALWAEYYRDGVWTRDNSLMSFLGGDDLGDELTEAEAEALIA
jgi:hypothetical protein